MPAPISITNNEQEWIKQYLQDTYDIMIVDAFDCQNLSNLIEKNKDIKISYSTFRRLFNLVPNTNSQSRFVLNSLAVAVGFKNWESFKLHVSSFDTNVINQNIQVYSLQLPNSSNLILETVAKLPVTTWMGGYQLQNIISLAIENKDYDLLKKVVQLPFDIDDKNVYEHLVIGFQSFYFQSVKNNLAVIEFVRTTIGTSILLQKCLLQAYVDEKYLNSFLSKWFDAIEENTLPDLLLFKNLLLCQKTYVDKEIDKSRAYYNFALQQCEKNQLKIHPILKARLGVWDLVLNNNGNTLENNFYSLSSPFDKADFVVIASRLLWTHYNGPMSFAFLEQISIKEFPPVKDFFQKGRYNMLLLTLAIHHYIKNDTALAKEFYELFNETTLGYDIVNEEFYSNWIDKMNKV